MQRCSRSGWRKAKRVQPWVAECTRFIVGSRLALHSVVLLIAVFVHGTSTTTSTIPAPAPASSSPPPLPPPFFTRSRHFFVLGGGGGGGWQRRRPTYNHSTLDCARQWELSSMPFSQVPKVPPAVRGALADAARTVVHSLFPLLPLPFHFLLVPS